ncbi:MAG TPA: HAMP domain-containing histidine kinase [Candidatus Pullilachnospira stercoravium]|uniref:histidine kinase n=1 Tax=Candidatus Pullilachnospira stercoravium TaxID=2840913 RepID=A0A9D1NVK0_9FIRM|nr:HAMP domain-containing histidine kinase [Candidatus Pullilachnospira stercoravium]
MRAMNRRNSIYVQLLRLLIVSAVAAVAIFVLMDLISTRLIGVYFENNNYEERHNQAYMTKLQNYIDQNHLSSRDAQELNDWVKSQKILYVQIYKDGIRVFDSAYPNEEIWEAEIEATDQEWETIYTLTFSDGTAQVSVVGNYAYQIFIYVYIAEIVICFGIFLLLVLLGIRKRMGYIRKLSQEVEILEGGSLDYPITVKGNDELATLAFGLDSMRKSFQELLNQEAKMVQENQRIVTEMSHDLRTPITSILLYTEILKRGNGKDRQIEYIEKIEKRARRMKQLTDHLFEYSLLTGETKVQMEEPELYEVLFYDLFSETCSYLEQRGFQVEFHVKWLEKKIQISTEYMLRIMDNITSNVLKYADPAYPIVISSAQEEHMAGFSFENHIRKTEETVESTGIGIKSIRNMTLKMKAKCQVEQEGDQFRLTILFPVKYKIEQQA